MHWSVKYVYFKIMLSKANKQVHNYVNKRVYQNCSVGWILVQSMYLRNFVNAMLYSTRQPRVSINVN